MRGKGGGKEKERRGKGGGKDGERRENGEGKEGERRGKGEGRYFMLHAHNGLDTSNPNRNPNPILTLNMPKLNPSYYNMK